MYLIKNAEAIDAYLAGYIENAELFFWLEPITQITINKPLSKEILNTYLGYLRLDLRDEYYHLALDTIIVLKRYYELHSASC
jgi:hypothetical protein